MKKLALILAALAVSTSVVLAGCTDKTPTNENTPGENNEQTEQSGEQAEEKETASLEVNEDVIAYNAEIEAAVEAHEAKNEIDNEILGTVNGLPISAATVKYAAGYTAFSESQGTTGEELDAIAENVYKENAVVVALAHKFGIEIGDDVKEYASTSVTSMKEYFDAMGEGEYEKYFVGQPFTPFLYHYQTVVYNYIYQKLYSAFSEDEARIAEAGAEAVKFYEENDFVRAKHILVMFPAGEGENGEISDAQKAETLEKANAVLEKVNAMSDISEFDALIAEYNEDPGMTSNPAGYYFGKGEMVPEFEETAYALEEGKTSGLVETSYGYHILLKLPIDDEGISSSAKFGEFMTEKFYNYVDEVMAEDFDIVYNENYEAKFDEFKAEYEAVMAAQEAEAAAAAEAEAAEAEAAE